MRPSVVLAARSASIVFLAWLSLPGARAQDPAAATEAAATQAADDGPVLFHWTDRRGVAHLTNEAPHQYDVSHDEWMRLKAEYPGRIVDDAPAEGEDQDDLAKLPPGARAEEALQQWWAIAGPRGAFRGHAVVSQDERIELDRLLAIARAALKEARGKDLSPATGRAAVDFRRASAVTLAERDAALAAGMTPDQLYPVSVSGRLVRGVGSVRYEVQGRVSNRSLSDAPGLSVSLFLEVDGSVIATRAIVVPRVMARGEAPVAAAFELPRQYGRLSDERLSLRTRVETLPELPSTGG